MKKKYTFFVSAILLLIIVLFLSGLVVTTLVFPIIDELFKPNFERLRKNILWVSIDNGLLSAIKITTVAVVIKFLKYWWTKQKEKEKLESEKLNTELQLLKAQIRPDFLFNTLDDISRHNHSMSGKAPDMLIKLSDFLSYVLYDCEEPTIKLEKEILMLKQYMELERIRRGKQLEMTIQINGSIRDQMISPLLLLPFVDNCFSYCNNEKMEQAWVSLDLAVDENYFSMKLISGLPAEIVYDNSNLENVKVRLQLLYPGKHELKVNSEKEMLLTYLNINLAEDIPEAETILVNKLLPKTLLNYAGV